MRWLRGHVASGTGEAADKGPGRNSQSEEVERLRESPVSFFSPSLSLWFFIKASALIASVKVTESFMSTWRVPALVCVAKQ